MVVDGSCVSRREPFAALDCAMLHFAQDDDEETGPMLLCDGCNKGTHLKCVTQAITSHRLSHQRLIDGA